MEKAKRIAINIDDIVMTQNSSATRTIMLGPVVGCIALTAYMTMKVSNDSDKRSAIEKRTQQSFDVSNGCRSSISNFPSPIQVHTFPAKIPTNISMKNPSISDLKIAVARMVSIVATMNFSKSFSVSRNPRGPYRRYCRPRRTSEA